MTAHLFLLSDQGFVYGLWKDVRTKTYKRVLKLDISASFTDAENFQTPQTPQNARASWYMNDEVNDAQVDY